MGNYPEVCCFKNVKVVGDYPVQTNNNDENPLSDLYEKQPNYSFLIFLQTRIKQFLKKKRFNYNENLRTKFLNGQYNKTRSSYFMNEFKTNNISLQKETTLKFTANLRQQTTYKEENCEKNNNIKEVNKSDFIEEQKLYFPKIVLNKDVNIFKENLFSKKKTNKKNDEDPRNGPFNGVRKKYPILVQDDFSYEGEWKNGKRDGIGILIKKEGAKYIGEFIEDKITGFGKLIDEGGDRYIGNWRDFQAHGIGSYNKKGVISYNGWWKKDRQHGFGIERWPKLEYIGEYYKGNKEGYGILTINDGIYEGQMKDGNINGIGCFTFKDKRKYEGEFVNNKIEGYGILTWPDGKVFVGSFKDDLEDGFGVFYTNKKIYIGVWQNMLLEGEVIVIEGDKKRKQLWEQGKCYKNLQSNYQVYFEKYVNDIIQQKNFYVK